MTKNNLILAKYYSWINRTTINTNDDWNFVLDMIGEFQADPNTRPQNKMSQCQSGCSTNTRKGYIEDLYGIEIRSWCPIYPTPDNVFSPILYFDEINQFYNFTHKTGLTHLDLVCSTINSSVRYYWCRFMKTHTYHIDTRFSSIHTCCTISKVFTLQFHFFLPRQEEMCIYSIDTFYHGVISYYTPPENYMFLTIFQITEHRKHIKVELRRTCPSTGQKETIGKKKQCGNSIGIF